jgi:hypothetical protein
MSSSLAACLVASVFCLPTASFANNARAERKTEVTDRQIADASAAEFQVRSMPANRIAAKRQVRTADEQDQRLELLLNQIEQFTLRQYAP